MTFLPISGAVRWVCFWFLNCFFNAYCHMFLNDFRSCWMMVRCQVLHGSYSRKIHSRVRGWSTWRWKLPTLWRLETNLKNIGLDLKQAAVYKKIGGLLGFAFVYWGDFVAPGNATNIRGSNIWGSSGRRSLRHFSGPFTRWGFFARIRLSPSQGHKESAITWYFWKPFRTLRQLMGSSWVLRIWCI